MKNKLAMLPKPFYLNAALSLLCVIANTFLKFFIRPRQEYLAQLWDIPGDAVLNMSLILRFLFIAGAFYFCIRAGRYGPEASKFKEQREDDERIKREYEEELAKAKEWLNS